MKKILLFLFIILPIYVFSQNALTLNLRDIDFTEFQQIKLYLNILDSLGKPVNDIDSSKILIIENQTGKKTIPTLKNFFKSDEGMAICFAIDASYSMNGAPLNNVKEGMLHILSELRPHDKMAISLFNDKFYKKTGFETDREILRNNINDLEVGGTSTELFMSVIEATKWLNSIESPKRKVLILISDGDDNSATYKIEDCIKELKNAGISVFSIGSIAENKISKNTLQNLEKISNSTKDGKYYKINSAEDLKNIIPLIYDRIKDEYILSYFSYAGISQTINGQIQVKVGDISYAREFEYKSPSKIIKNAPAIGFFETKEFLYGSIGAGIILIALLVFLIINVKKKKRYKSEKEQEQHLREEEARINKERFESLQGEYDNLLDQLENASVVTDSDKMKISELEKKIEEASKTFVGTPANIDYRRRTMILNSKSFPPSSEQGANFNQPSLTINNGIYAGRTVMITPAGLLIGRKEGNLVLQDDTISRMHAKIFFSNGIYYIEDLNSTNGTFINERKIRQQQLNNNDVIRVGNISLIFKS